MLYIFDWDGTISDSAAKIVGCMQKAAHDIDIDVKDEAAIKNIIGLGLPEAIAALYPELSEDMAEQLRVKYAEHFVRDDVEPSPFFPGVMETLQCLRNQGHTLTVATGKSRRGLDRVLNNLDMVSFFHGSRCADETASKPNPMMLEELLEEHKYKVEEAVMVGDTEYDMAMAHAIGMQKIAVSYGAHHISRLQNYDPVLCVNDFQDILDWE